MIEKLTKEQEKQLKVYRDRGLEIGYDTNTEFDLELVKDLCNKHRELCGVKKAKTFKVYDSPYAAIKDITSLSVYNALYGQHDINWLNYYMYYREVLGLVEETESIKYLYELAKHVGWMWFSSDTVIITRKPKELHLTPKQDDINVLHRTDGMALSYKDGYGIYMLNGILVPKEYRWVVTTPVDDLKVADVIKIANTEIRTEAIKKIGMERMFSKLDKKLLDNQTYEIGGNYKLYEIDLNGSIRKYLSMFCPSKQSMHLEAVHPDCFSVLSALNWREHEVISDDYTFPLERT